MLTPRQRRPLLAIVAAAAAIAASVIAPSSAVADTSSTLTVVGTSDVFDSNLVQTVIKPGFEAAYPGVTLNYVSKGSGAAIQYAEAGSASALLVHAASLENQFVASGYSLNGDYGRAIFWGDYVLLGPPSDPLHIFTQHQHDIVGAFEKIAQAGASGKANFVSRGGTPGTTVQEHLIWALTSGVTTCAVSDVNGGGTSPSTTTGDCPVNISYPSWYHATGLTQAPNIVNADACNYTGGNCYVLTDRGTFNYLQSTGAAQDLKIVVRNNNAKSAGGVGVLVNSFHAYAINPNKFSSSVASTINTTAATEFLSWVTSPAAQTAIGAYLNGTNDPPFLPDAAPHITATAPKAATAGAAQLTISGQISNVVPTTPPLAGKTVILSATDNASTPVTTQLKTAVTDANGRYKFTFTPTESATYTVSTGEIQQIEDPTLNPVFGDLLAPASVVAGSSTLTGKPAITKVVPAKGSLTISGTVSPAPVDSSGTVVLYASLNGAAETAFGTVNLAAGQTTFTQQFPLVAGSYSYRLGYSDAPYVAIGYSAPRTANVR